MKKIKKIIFTIFSIFIVTACANVSVKEDLQENNWNFAQNDGVAGNVDFSNDTAVFETTGTFSGSSAYKYKLNDDETEIIFTQTDTNAFTDEQEVIEIKYSIEKNDDEYLLSLISDSSDKLQDGFNITLTTKTENNNDNSN